MSVAVIRASWDDAPHLTEEQKQTMLASYPAHQRDARTRGIPQLGAGAVFPYPESECKLDPFPMAAHWPRAYALDVGWRVTAALWFAKDPATGVIYVYSEYYGREREPSVHAAAIRARGEWIPGVVDPAARGRSQVDGRKLIDMYRDLGLDLKPADNSVEAGVALVNEALSAGTLKIMSHLPNFWREYRMYRRDEHGRIIKQDDHLCDVLRYGLASGIARARVRAEAEMTREIARPASSAGY